MKGKRTDLISVKHRLNVGEKYAEHICGKW
jgi:hypothetical protein